MGLVEEVKTGEVVTNQAKKGEQSVPREGLACAKACGGGHAETKVIKIIEPVSIPAVCSLQCSD